MSDSTPDIAAELAAINEKLDLIIGTVEAAFSVIASHPMLKSLGIKF